MRTIVDLLTELASREHLIAVAVKEGLRPPTNLPDRVFRDHARNKPKKDSKKFLAVKSSENTGSDCESGEYNTCNDVVIFIS